MSFEPSETEESASSLSEVNYLDNALVRIKDANAEFRADNGFLQGVTSTLGDNTILPIDYYR